MLNNTFWMKRSGLPFGAVFSGLALALLAIANIAAILRQANAVPLAAHPVAVQQLLEPQSPVDRRVSAHPQINHSPVNALTIGTRRSTRLARSTQDAIVSEAEIPVRIAIPSISLDAPIIPAETKSVKVEGKEFQQWLAPDQFAAGWHTTSARLGEPGNTVLNGHHNIHGQVFSRLVDLNPGDTILVYSDKNIYVYQIANKMILPEKYQELDMRMNNAQWILASQDERLTLITCWPAESNTHRLILVAKPLLRVKQEHRYD